jgi:hypothetical protein
MPMPLLNHQPSWATRRAPADDGGGGAAAAAGSASPPPGGRPPAHRTPSGRWGRLRPAPRDELLAYGLPSRGETR